MLKIESRERVSSFINLSKKILPGDGTFPDDFNIAPIDADDGRGDIACLGRNFFVILVE